MRLTVGIEIFVFCPVCYLGIRLEELVQGKRGSLLRRHAVLSKRPVDAKGSGTARYLSRKAVDRRENRGVLGRRTGPAAATIIYQARLEISARQDL
jgi:hypothetical protein